MTALVVTFLLMVPGSDGLLDRPQSNASADADDDRQAARMERDRCLGAGAAGAVGVALGAVVGGGVAYLIGEGVKAADASNTTASKAFDSFAVPLGAIAGGVVGAAVGTIGAYDLSKELASKPSVMR